MRKQRGLPDGEQVAGRRPGAADISLQDLRPLRMMSVEIKVGAQIEVGVTRPLFQLPPSLMLGLRDVSATPDGKRFLVIEDPQRDQSPGFMIVLNWAADLK